MIAPLAAAQAGGARADGAPRRGDPGAVLHHGDDAHMSLDLPGFADPVRDAKPASAPCWTPWRGPAGRTRAGAA